MVVNTVFDCVGIFWNIYKFCRKQFRYAYTICPFLKKMFKKFFVYLICGTALLLPFRARIIYAEFIAWFVQLFYYIYYSIMKIILKEIQNDGK